MINKRGQIFHIDFGYLLDNPRAYNNIVISSPNIKMTSDIIDFLGGSQGMYYNEFKEYMIKVYDIMRLYKNAIVIYYHMIGSEGFVDWDIFKDRLEQRFMNGLKTKDISITLINEVETSNNWQSSLIDFAHGSRQKIAEFFGI
jgi:phosphatidylinositol kinase/protein kinase (PI-3  family)